MRNFRDNLRLCNRHSWVVIIGFVSVILLGTLFIGCHKDSDSPVTPDPTATPEPILCDGMAIGGFCWYYGAIGESCEAVCAPHGSYNEATKSYAGSEGTDSQCMQVLETLGALSDADGQLTVSTEAQGFGCHVWEIALGTEGLRAQWYRSLTPTTAEAASADPWIRRACACQQ